MDPPTALIERQASPDNDVNTEDDAPPRKQNDELDFDWLHEIGCGCDDSELPHHVSTPAQIDELMSGVERVLGSLPKPQLVTVAR